MASGSVVYGTLPSLSLVLLQLKGWWQDVNLFHMTTSKGGRMLAADLAGDIDKTSFFESVI